MHHKSNQILSLNKAHYDHSWHGHKIKPHTAWPHWQIIKKHVKTGPLLELGPGSKPKIPVQDNSFVEISQTAAKKLSSLGGKVIKSNLTTKLPFPDQYFQAVLAFELLEHLPNDQKVLREIHRVLVPSGIGIVSFPLHMNRWNTYDATVGHVRRYEPNSIEKIVKQAGFAIKAYAGIDIPWPSKFTGSLLSFLWKLNPQLFSTTAQWLDDRPGAAISAPINTRQWNNQATDYLQDFSTGLFVLTKS